MASASEYIIKTGISFDAKGAEAKLKKLKDQAQELRGEMDKLYEAYEKETDADKKLDLQKQWNTLNDAHKTQEKFIKNYEGSVHRIQKALQNGLQNMSIKELKQTLNEIEKQQQRLRTNKGSEEEARVLAELYRNVNLQIGNIRAGITQLNTDTNQLDKLTVDQLQNLLARLKANKEALSQGADGTFDPQKAKETEVAIDKVNNKLMSMKAGFKDVNAILDGVDDKSAYKNSLDDLQKMKAVLQDYRRTAQDLPDEEMKRIDNAIRDIELHEKQAVISAEEFNRAVSKPKDASYNQLKLAAERLKSELKNMTENQEDYNKKTEELNRVKARIKEVEESWVSHNSTIGNAVSRLRDYVLVYMGFRELMAKGSEFFRDNLELSDQMVNVQKVTNMANSEIKELVDNLQSLDTRTTTTELMQFAEQAGKLGIYTEHGVKGMQEFVQQAERINATLGEDIGGAEAVASLAKVNDILGETGKLGGSVAAALDATGSAILNVGNNSSAGYAAIVNYVGRLGAIGSTAQMSMADLVALGGTLDALKMPAEAGSTALAQFMSALTNNVESMAKAAGISVIELEKKVHGFVDDMGNVVAPDMIGAMKMLFDAVNRGAASAQDLMNAMSGRSRTNVNIRSMIQLYSSHMELLNSQLEYAQQGYDSAIKSADEFSKTVLDAITKQEEMSIMSQEFARVNENAEGILKRLTNSFKELFVNSSMVEFFESILRSVKDLVDAIAKSQDMLIVFKSTLVAIAVGFGTATMGVNRFVVALFKGQVGIRALSMEFRNLGKMLARNWFTLLATVLTEVAMLWYELANKIDLVKQKFKEIEKEENKEIDRLNILTNRLNSVNIKQNERLSIIRQLNNTYGRYLGFMLQESDNARTIAAAHDLIIAKLKEESLLKKQNALADSVAEKYGSGIQDSKESIRSVLGSSYVQGRGQTNTKGREDEIMGYIISSVSEQLTSGNRDVAKINDEVKKYLQKNGVKLDAKMLWDRVEKFIAVNIEAQNDLDKNMNDLQSELNGVQQGVGRNALKTLNELANSISELQKGGIDNSELGAYVDKLNSYITVATKNNINEGQIKKNVAIYGKQLAEYQKKLDEWGKNGMREAIWGKDGNKLEEMSTETLKAMVERYDAIENDIKDGMDILQTFPELADKVQGMTPEQIRSFLFNEWKKAKDELERRNDNKGGNFVDPKDSSRSAKQKLKDELNAYIQQLDEYYEHRKEIIEAARAAEEITDGEMNRRIEHNDQEHYEMRYKLRNGFLHREEQLTQAEMDMLNDYFQEMDENNVLFTKKGIENLGTRLGQTFGHYMMQGISLAAQKDKTSIQKIAVAQQKRIQEILDKDNPFAKLRSGLRDELDKMDLLLESYAGKNLDEMITKHLDFLMKTAQGAVSMTAQGLRKAMVEAGFFDWARSLTDDEMKALLLQLQNFQVEYEQAVSTLASKTKSLYESKREQSGKENGYKNWEKDLEEEQNTANAAAMVTGTGTDWNAMTQADNIELDKLRMKVAYQQEYLNGLEQEYNQKIMALKIAGQDAEAQEMMLAKKQSMAEANEKLRESVENLQKAEIERIGKTVAQLKPYQDALDSFAYAMGEGLFGSKKDRQEAAKELLKSVAQTTLDLIKQRLMYQVQTKIMDQADIVQKKATSAAVQAVETADAAQSFSREVMLAQATLGIEQTKSTAKAFGKSFWVGLAVSAAISAVFAGLMGMLNGAMKKGQQATNTGSSNTANLTTGALTYAEGRYPILGSDGHTYTDYKVAGKLNTGVYHGTTLGIFSEKKPEAVIDGDTTETLIMDYPKIWNAILTISRNGKLVNGGAQNVAAHAAGTLSAVSTAYGVQQTEAPATDNSELAQAILALQAATAQLNGILANGIQAKMNYFGPDGERERMKNADKWARQRGL